MIYLLNIVWPVFIIISFSYAILSGNIENLNSSIFESTSNAVNLSINLLGTICLWNGVMQIANSTKIVYIFSNVLKPIIKKLFPEIKSNNKIQKEISMNIVANILGLGNAATPLGLKAMQSMQKENTRKDRLTDSMMMFIVINTASIQVIPTTVIAIRNSLGAKNPTEIVFPVWIATILAAITRNNCYKNNYKTNKIKKYLRNNKKMKIMNFISNIAMPMIILIIVISGLKDKKNVFDIFLDGAKEGIETTINIFPTLIGLFVAIGALRSSGILDIIINYLNPILKIIHFSSELMPLSILRPISGSGSIAIATDIMKQFGVDSLLGKTASTIMGSTETTIYTIAIYTSCIKVKNTRYILFAALCADIIGIVTSVVVCNLLYNK